MEAWTLIKDILKSPFGSFAFVFSIMIFTYWLTHFISTWIATYKAEHGTLKKTTDKMDVTMDEIRRELSFIKGSIDVINKMSVSTTQSRSPISLTDLGHQVASKLNAESLIALNWDKIFMNLEINICDKNAYDIQVYCMERVAVEPEKFFDREALSQIKLLAYNEGNPFQYYSNVLAVLIRDKYLSIKGIDHSQIDANDPSLTRPKEG